MTSIGAAHPFRVRVSAQPPGPAGYDVIIAPGALGEIVPLIRSVVSAAHFAVIADADVARLYGDAVIGSLRQAADRALLFEFPAGERHKTRQTWGALTDAILAAGFGRDACVVALGGGVTGDLAGFVAATYMRGLPFVQLPTTLLAMIDASVGGKTGVDTDAGKNLVGAFLQPKIVVADPLVLRTLPDGELRAGLAEAVKHGAIADDAYLRDLVASAADLFARDPAALTAHIGRSVQIKAAIVGRDTEERGERASLNFGHTVAHALERVSGFALHHGFAVATGMIVETELGERMGITRAGTAAILRDALRLLDLPVQLPPAVSPGDVIAAAATDKKARAGRLRFSLIERPGVPARGPHGEWTHVADPAALLLALERCAAG